MNQAEDPSQRLDHWLWCARFAHTRGRCSELVAAGLVRINRRRTNKPHARLHPGDVLTLALGRGVRVVRVQGLAPRRCPPAAAALLYVELREDQDPCAADSTPAYPFAR